MSVTRSHSLSIGIVGLPNAGKSTLFNSITKNSVPAENFPFCTIDKNVGVVEVPDRRLDKLSQFFKATKVVPSAITFVDIAGLVKGASQGEGLGNQFLSHIREVDVIMYVLRSFSSETVSHVYERVDPAEDFAIVQSELILKDIETVAKKLSEISKKARTNSSTEVAEQLGILTRLNDWLNSDKPAIEMPCSQEEAAFIRDMWLLTFKKRMFMMNVRAGTDDQLLANWAEKLQSKIPQEEWKYIVQVDVKLVGEMSAMSDAEKAEYLELLDQKPTTVEDIISRGFERLNLLTFYTGSEKEVNAWSVEAGLTAQEAAGVIHTDLADTFVKADVVNVESMIETGGLVTAKEKGLVKNVGKDYIVQDGDYIIVHTTAK